MKTKAALAAPYQFTRSGAYPEGLFPGESIRSVVVYS
jgi:hypothetical protein